MKTKSLVSDGDEKVEQRDTETPPRKKLKQARLPFQILTSGVESSTPPYKNNKRKLETSDDIKVVKVIKHESSPLCETKENVCSPSVTSDCKKSVETCSKSQPTHNSSSKDLEGVTKTSGKISQKCEAGKSQEVESTSENVRNTDLKSEGLKSEDISESGNSEEDAVIISDDEEVLSKSSLKEDEETVSEDKGERKEKEQVVNHEQETTEETDSEDKGERKEKEQVVNLEQETTEETVCEDKGERKEKEKVVNHEEETTVLFLHLSDSEHSDVEENVSGKSMKTSSLCVKNDTDSKKTSRKTKKSKKEEKTEETRDEKEDSNILIGKTTDGNPKEDTSSNTKSSENSEKLEETNTEVSNNPVKKSKKSVSRKNNSSEITDVEENANEVTEKNTINTGEQITSDNLKTPKQKSPVSFFKGSRKNSEMALDEISDFSSAECTPKSERKGEKTSPLSSKDSAQKIRKLTPKQLQKQLESAKKKEEKERQRQEREKKKAEEKEEKEKKKAEEKEEKLRQKQEKEEQKKKEKEEKEELKRKEKEEKEELKKKEKEEKEKKKLLEIEIKNEEKRKKQGKRQAEAAAFTSFFVSRKSDAKPAEEPKAKVEEHFMPFEVKPDMRLAPNSRSNLDNERKLNLENAIAMQNVGSLYLHQLKKKEITPQRSLSTWSLSDLKNEVVILDDDEISGNVDNSVIETYPAAGKMPRPKLLQFWENRRPPYWGTWRKKSQSITRVKPFSKDEKYFDYEVDSDDEWEEEEPGESLHGSDDEKESEDEYEVDNEFFVPHGYLSDEENEEEESQSPEMLKTKLKLLELEFEEEMKQKTERIKPRVIGCIWIDPKNTDAVGSQLLKLLSPFQAVYQDGPIDTSAPEPASGSGSPEVKSNISSPATSAVKRRKFPEEGIPALIRLIHGNINKREFLIREFIAYWTKEQQKLRDETPAEGSENTTPSDSSSGDIVKRSVSNKIKELATWIACPDEGPMNGRMCWYVTSETRELYGLSDLTLPNTSWKYTIKPKRRESDLQIATSSPASANESTPKQLITKFTKVMTDEERKKQFTPVGEEGTEIKSGSGASSQFEKTQRKLVFNSVSKGSSQNRLVSKESTSGNIVQQRKKVPILMSVPRGHDVPKSSSVSLMKFMKPENSQKDGKNISKTVDNESKVNVTDKNSDKTECITLE